MKIVEKPPRNSAGFCGGGHGLSWDVEPRKEEEEEEGNRLRKWSRKVITKKIAEVNCLTPSLRTICLMRCNLYLNFL
jgi:hypothetical protein